MNLFFNEMIPIQVPFKTMSERQSGCLTHGRTTLVFMTRNIQYFYGQDTVWDDLVMNPLKAVLMGTVIHSNTKSREEGKIAQETVRKFSNTHSALFIQEYRVPLKV